MPTGRFSCGPTTPRSSSAQSRPIDVVTHCTSCSNANPIGGNRLFPDRAMGRWRSPTYIRGHAGQRQTPCRYDTVYVSEHLDVEDVRYLYHESTAAGSDHAAVATRLTLTT